jgi:hypothetical protein
MSSKLTKKPKKIFNLKNSFYFITKILHSIIIKFSLVFTKYFIFYLSLPVINHSLLRIQLVLLPNFNHYIYFKFVLQCFHYHKPIFMSNLFIKLILYYYFKFLNSYKIIYS